MNLVLWLMDHAYGIMLAIGIIAFALIELWLFRKNNISENAINNLIVICALSGAMFAIGALCFDGLWHSIEEAHKNGKFVWNWNGITYSGGLFSAIITYFIIYFIIEKNERHLMFQRLDLIVIGICIAHSFGRIGCYFGGCCYGKEVPANTFTAIPYFVNGEQAYVLPTFFYESLFLVILAIVLFFFVKRNRTSWYLIGYNTFRFFIEFLRGDDRGYSPFGFLTPSQFLGIIMIILGIILIIWRTKIEQWLKTKNVPITINQTINSADYQDDNSINDGENHG